MAKETNFAYLEGSERRLGAKAEREEEKRLPVEFRLGSCDTASETGLARIEVGHFTEGAEVKREVSSERMVASRGPMTFGEALPDEDSSLRWSSKEGDGVYCGEMDHLEKEARIA